MAKAVNDDTIQYFKPELSCQLQYWGYSGKELANNKNQPLENFKTKILKVHPVYSLLLTCDESENVALWNYDHGQLIWSQNVYMLIQDSVSNDAKKTAVVPPKSSSNSRSVERIGGYIPLSTTSIDFSSKKGSDPNIKPKESFGKVKDVDFADYTALSYNGTEYANGTSENRVIVLFEQAVVVVDLLSKRVYREVTTGSGKAPNAVDFLTPKLCLIACSDGNIRVLNLQNGKVEKNFSASKSEICCMRVIPYENQVEEQPEIQKVRLFTLGGDGVGNFWSITILNGTNIINGTEAPFARLSEILPGKILSQNLVIDRENSHLIIRVADHKLFVWDLTDLNSLRNSLNREVRRQSSARRGSVLSSLKFSSNNAVEDNFPKINTHAVLKIEKSLQTSISKIYSFTPLKQASFNNGLFIISSKGDKLTIVKNNSANGGEDSEQASAITTANEKQRLGLLVELNVQNYVNEYFQKLTGTQQSLQLVEPLKIYSVQSKILSTHLLFLGTSYGPMVLSFPLSLNGPFVGYHPLWKNNIIVSLDNFVRRIYLDYQLNVLTQSSESLPSSLPASMDLETDIISEIKYEKTNEKLATLTDSKSKTKAAPAANMNNPFKEAKPIILPSPNGKYCCIFWLDLCTYSIISIPHVDLQDTSYRLKPKDSFNETETSTQAAKKLGIGNKRTSFSGNGNGLPQVLNEIERGNCLEFAWLSHSDSLYIIKTPVGQKTIQVVDKNRRGSITSLFSKQEKFSKQNLFNDLILKKIVPDMTNNVVGDSLQKLNVSFEIPNPAYDPHIVIDEKSHQPPIPERISLNLQHIHDFYSGILLNMNYQIYDAQHPEPITNKAAVPPVNNNSAEEVPIVEAKNSFENVYNQFFFYHTKQQKFLPVGPILPRMIQVKWDYENSFCALQTISGTINVFKLEIEDSNHLKDDHEDQEKNFNLISIATIDILSFHNNPYHAWNQFHWNEGILWIHQSISQSINQSTNNQFVLYSFWKDEISDRQPFYTTSRLEVSFEKKVTKISSLYLNFLSFQFVN